MTLSEIINEVTLYRGHSAADAYIGNQPIVWFSYDEPVAAGYSQHRPTPTITTIDYDPVNSVDVGRSEQVTTIGALLSTIVKNSAASPDLIDKVKPVFLELRKQFGQTPHTLDKFWAGNDTFAKFLDLLGIDSIITTEGDYKTIGILRKYL